MDRELLETYGKGIIATTGCPSGEVQRLLQQDRFDDACQAASDYRDIFGKDNFFCELMDHGIGIERQVRDDLLPSSRRSSTCRGLATNDLHYTYAEDAKPHEVLLCVQTGKTLADPNRFKFDAQDFYLKSPAEMRAQWDPQFPEACDNTLLIAERVDVEFTEGQDLMPRAPGARGRDRGVAGWSRRSSGGCTSGSRTASPSSTASRPSTSSASSCQMGFPGYFLVTADLIQYAKSVGIRVGPGRGSAAGSLVAYVAGHHRPRPDQAQADLRAVPQPRAHLDARHRHGLRRAPARRDDPLRHARSTARTGSRRSSPTPRSRRRPRSRTPRGCCSASPATRWPTGSPRPCRRRSWARTSRCRASSTRPTSATPRPPRSAPSTSPTRRSRRSSTPPAASRASSGSGACTPPA